MHWWKYSGADMKGGRVEKRWWGSRLSVGEDGEGGEGSYGEET